MRTKNLFKDHPASVGETYLQHFGSAMSFTGAMLVAAFCCAIHAVLPFLFEKTGSGIITNLHDRMVTNRSRLKTEPPQGATPSL